MLIFLFSLILCALRVNSLNKLLVNLLCSDTVDMAVSEDPDLTA